MTTKMMCLEERPGQYQGKTGLVKSQLASLADMSEGTRLTHTIEYSLTEAEKADWAGKLRGKTVEVGVHEFTQFGGKIRARGHLISVEGKAVKAA